MSNSRPGTMLIDPAIREFVGAKDTLLRRLEADVRAAGMSDGEIVALIAAFKIGLREGIHRS